VENAAFRVPETAGNQIEGLMARESIEVTRLAAPNEWNRVCDSPISTPSLKLFSPFGTIHHAPTLFLD